MNDDVNNPKHYNQNGIEVIDVIETYAKSDFRLANVIKYVCRCEYKGNKLQDLRKAHWYLNRVIEELEEAEKVDFELSGYYWLQPSLDRIAGDDDASQRIKAKYYGYDGDDVVAVCRNPACRAAIRAGEIYVLDDEGRVFCCTACRQIAGRAQANR